jgi:transcriptional regulator with GAF, ATPase, and Fis domain
VLKLDWWQDYELTGDSAASQALEQIERGHIIAVLEKCHWKINGDNGAAEVLNMHPNTLRSKMKRLGIVRPQPKSSGEVVIPGGYIPHGSMG